MENVSAKGASDGKITGLNSTMEYKKPGETSWTKVSAGTTELTGLSAGTYSVRTAATANSYASASHKLTVSEGSAESTTSTDEPTTPAETHTHTYGSWKVTKSATVLAYGKKQRTCTVCGTVQTKKIAKLTKPAYLSAKATPKSSASMKISWTKYSKADGYEVYGAKCGGKKTTFKLLKTTKKTSYTHKKLKKTGDYKYYVKAYKKVNGKKVYLAKSATLHAAMKKAAATNAAKVKVKKTSVSLKVGKTAKIKASLTKEAKSKKLLTHAKKYRYYTTDKTVASVNSKGKITAKTCGTCTIYVVANNGCYKKVKVTVK